MHVRKSDRTADTQNRLHVKVGADFQYDPAGNMTHDATANLNYSYDQENRITGAARLTYTYDADGNRVEKSNGATGTLYWYMSPGIVAESDLAGNLQSEYIFFDGERVSRKDFPGNAVSYYFSDHLKTTDIVTDAQGNIKNESDYYPWGGELQFVLNDSNHYKFTGKERDSETGLDYFGARYYSNGLGRFITPDWSATPVPVPYADLDDPQSLNQYGYVRDIPTSRVDADGHGWAPYELANWIDSHIDRAMNQQNNSAVSSGHPAVAAAVTLNNGLATDTIKGFTNLLRLGQSVGSLPEGASTNDKIVAVAQEGGRVGGIILTVVAVAGPKSAPAPVGDTLKPGPFAGDGVPASGPRITAAEQRAINAEGAQYGCHTCGTPNPGTKSANWVGDHQPVTALNRNGAPQTLYSQCLHCSRVQGGQAAAAKRAAASQPVPAPTPVLPVPAAQQKEQH